MLGPKETRDRFLSGLSLDRAVNDCRWLAEETPWRLSGSETAERAAAYIVEKLRAAGVTAAFGAITAVGAITAAGATATVEATTVSAIMADTTGLATSLGMGTTGLAVATPFRVDRCIASMGTKAVV